MGIGYSVASSISLAAQVAIESLHCDLSSLRGILSLLAIATVVDCHDKSECKKPATTHPSRWQTIRGDGAGKYPSNRLFDGA